MRLPHPIFQAPDSPTTPASTPTPSAPLANSGASTSSTPSTTPSSPPVPSGPPDSPTEGGVDSSAFEFMFDSHEVDPFEGPGLSPPSTVAPELTTTQPAQVQPVMPAATTSEPVRPDPGTVTPAPTEVTSPTTVTQPQPTLDPFDPGTLAQHLAQNEEQVVQQVADTLFKLSDKDVEALESDTVGTIPKLLARAFVASQRNYLMQMARILPTMIQRHGEVTKRHTEAEGEFYTRWPDVKKDQHGPLVMQYAAVYRQMHPEASRKDMIEALGPMVMMAAKVVPSVPSAQPNGSAPPTSPMTNGSRPPQPTPFLPAGPSAGGAFPSTAQQLSPIEAMFAGADE